MRVWYTSLSFDRSNFNIIIIYHCGTVYLEIYNFILNLRLRCSSLKHIHQQIIKKKANSLNQNPCIFSGESVFNYSSLTVLSGEYIIRRLWYILCLLW